MLYPLEEQTNRRQVVASVVGRDARLTDRQSQALLEYASNGMNIAETGRALGISGTCTRLLLLRALDKVKSKIIRLRKDENG